MFALLVVNYKFSEMQNNNPLIHANAIAKNINMKNFYHSNELMLLFALPCCCCYCWLYTIYILLLLLLLLLLLTSAAMPTAQHSD